jgi:hypothetical protein
MFDIVSYSRIGRAQVMFMADWVTLPFGRPGIVLDRLNDSRIR